ncbi:MAG TPA: lipoprotein signal peptidase [Sulfurospirillum arcachonense]|nr:lipoprotein signal peptidase [Sulfurospirillum arcachonense]HIP45584.1 lipoprotein signal peptidase [Sulfurospirillum arcachonense]
MAKSLIVFVLVFVGVFVIDQNLKTIFLEGFRWYGEYFSLILTYNKGVAFSMLSFLEGNLKYIQIALLSGVFLYLVFNKDIFRAYSLPAGMILGAGCSNLYDRFIHGGVVDYFYWHKWFSFAVFNFADVMINISVVIILLLSFRKT